MYSYKLTYKCQRCGRDQKTPKINARQVKQFIPPRCEVCHRVLCLRCLKYNLCKDDFDKLPKEILEHVKVLQRKETRNKNIGRLILLGGILLMVIPFIWLILGSKPTNFEEMINYQGQSNFWGGLAEFGIVLLVAGIIVTICIGGGWNKAQVSRYISSALQGQFFDSDSERHSQSKLEVVESPLNLELRQGLDREKPSSTSMELDAGKFSPPSENKSQQKTCPQCTNVLPIGAMFCNKCGYKF